MSHKSTSPCALCGKREPLRTSHVLPAFVFKWLKASSATGYIRFGQTPNRRVQDGIKLKLLCAGCESHLSVFETEFANNVFHPLNSDSSKSVHYGSWLLPFCVSISWRVLAYMRNEVGISNLDSTQQGLVQSALARWSEVLLGQKPHPGQFEQHLLPLDPIASHTVRQLPANIDRYFLRALEMDVLSTRTSTCTYAKLGKFAVFGVIQSFDARWKGTKVHVRTGTVGPCEYSLPGEVLSLFIERANSYGDIQARISGKQHDIIEGEIQRNPRRVQASGTVAALLEDQRLFGTNAVFRR